MGQSDNLAHVEKVQARMMEIVNELSNRARWHDNSKFHSPELEGYEQLHERLTPIAYGTSEYKAAMSEFKWLLNHHFEANDHHPEHYMDGVNGMSLLSILEMLADWKAASQRPQSTSTLAQGMRWNIERFKINSQLALILLNTATALSWVTLREAAELETWVKGGRDGSTNGV